MELFGRSKEEWLKSFLELPNGISSHDTFGEVFSRINPDQFQSRFMAWTQEIAQLVQGEVVAIDGKMVRRSHDGFRGKGAIHLVSAWASANSMTLGQVKVDEKSNEITAIPRLLELLTLHGCIVTIDAMGCQKEIARQIVDAGADYVLAVKQNQGHLFEDVRDLFQGAEEFGFEGVPLDFARTVEKGHGRIESRECWVVADPGCLEYLENGKQWAGLEAAVKVPAWRETDRGVSIQSRYYISSLKTPAARMLQAIRRRWSV